MNAESLLFSVALHSKLGFLQVAGVCGVIDIEFELFLMCCSIHNVRFWLLGIF